jgi:hypothetical protein
LPPSPALYPSQDGPVDTGSGHGLSGHDVMQQPIAGTPGQKDSYE